jgi:hypothetical protein
MALTSLEKHAGRIFAAARQAALDALNESSPPAGFVLPVWRVVRHPCPVRGLSIGIELREHYQASPLYKVCCCGVVAEVTAPEGDFPHWDCGANSVALAEGLLAWIWKDGRCPDCGLVLRSRRGRYVLAASRPPEGRERRVGG